MKVTYINNKGDRKLYNLFLEVLNIKHKEYEADEVDKLIINDTIRLIDRVITGKCKKTLGRIGVKGYSDLKSEEIKELLRVNLPKAKEEEVINFYNDNKVILGMFKYEVLETLRVSSWEFNRIKDKLKVSGKQTVNVSGKPKTVVKYDRRFIYEVLLYKKIEYNIHRKYKKSKGD